MIFNYLSHRQAGPIHLLMPRSEVRQILKVPCLEFKKTEFSSNTTDAFDSLGIHVYYDNQDAVKGIEIFAGSSQLIYKKLELLGMPLKKLIASLKKLKIDFEEDSLGITLENGRIALYVPEKGDDRDSMILAAYITLILPTNDD